MVVHRVCSTFNSIPHRLLSSVTYTIAVMFTVYVDDSGSDPNQTTAVAGVLIVPVRQILASIALGHRLRRSTASRICTRLSAWREIQSLMLDGMKRRFKRSSAARVKSSRDMHPRRFRSQSTKGISMPKRHQNGAKWEATTITLGHGDPC